MRKSIVQADSDVRVELGTADAEGRPGGGGHRRHPVGHLVPKRRKRGAPGLGVAAHILHFSELQQQSERELLQNLLSKRIDSTRALIFQRVPKLQAEDQAIWWDTLNKMQKLFRKAALSLFTAGKISKDTMHNYFMSGRKRLAVRILFGVRLRFFFSHRKRGH